VPRDLQQTLETLARRLAPGAKPSPDLAAILAMPLDQFAREGQLLEVRVPWLDVTVWFVPEERDAEALGREGVPRGRVWTATELMGVMALPGRTAETVQGLALAKRAIDGDIVDVRPDGSWCPSARSGPENAVSSDLPHRL
jgi:hypothetical protein